MWKLPLAAGLPRRPVLEQLGKAIESSRLAGEFPLRVARRYRLGCDRYRYAGRDAVEAAPTPLRLVVVNDPEPPVA